MKKYILLLSLLVLPLLFVACSSQSMNERISKSVGVKINENIQLDYEDTHGGFQGDGEIVAVISFDVPVGDKILTDIRQSKGWHHLPLSQNLSLLMYGGEEDNQQYSFNLAEKLAMPTIENGYYFFVNRHPNRVSSVDDTNIFKEGSFNFTLAVYDVDTRIMYYLEFDT